MRQPEQDMGKRSVCATKDKTWDRGWSVYETKDKTGDRDLYERLQTKHGIEYLICIRDSRQNMG